MQFGITSFITLLAATAVMAAPAEVPDAMLAESANTCAKQFTVLGFALDGCTSSAVTDGLAVSFRSFVDFGIGRCQQSDLNLASFTAYKSSNAPSNCYVRSYTSNDCSTRLGATCSNGPVIKKGGQCTNTVGGGLPTGLLTPARSFKVVCGARPATCSS